MLSILPVSFVKSVTRFGLKGFHFPAWSFPNFKSRIQVVTILPGYNRMYAFKSFMVIVVSKLYPIYFMGPILIAAM